MYSVANLQFHRGVTIFAIVGTVLNYLEFAAADGGQTTFYLHTTHYYDTHSLFYDVFVLVELGVNQSICYFETTTHLTRKQLL